MVQASTEPECPAEEAVGVVVSAPAVTIETTADEWTQYVLQHQNATGYHEWQWRDVFKRAFGHESIYLAARVRGQIVGVLPLVLLDSWIAGRALISLPFLNYGGVIADNPLVARALLDRAASIGAERRCRHIELRHTTRQFPDLPCKRHKVGMLLDLHPPDVTWERLDRKVRNQIRKSQKSNLTHERGGVELLDDFYAVFARNMRDLGTPVYGRSFFTNVLSAFPHRTELHIVRLEKTPIAGALTFRTGAATEVPWASSVREFNSLCSNHLMYWRIIERACSIGCATLDFGRSTPNEGTYRFKEQWGARPLPLCWEYQLLGSGSALPNTSPTNPKFKLAISLWKKLPIGITTRIGPSIVRWIP